MNSGYFLALVGNSLEQNNGSVFGNLLEATGPAIEKNFRILRDTVLIILRGGPGGREKSL